MSVVIQSSSESPLNKTDVIGILQRLDDYFHPPLSSRVDLDAYSEKLLSSSSIEYLLSEGKEIAGLIAYYCNDTENKIAYITYTGLLPEYHGKGMAGKLLDTCISRCVLQNMRMIIVCADEMNEKAIGLYKSRGFKTTLVLKDRWRQGMNSIQLQKDLERRGSTVT